jgi:hypothetical protein
MVFRVLLAITDEVHVESKEAAIHAAFPRHGVTDSVLLKIAADEHLLLTAGFNLYHETARQGHPAINFTHHIEVNR